MPGATYLAGETVTLCTVEEADLEFLRETINDPAVRKYLGRRGPINLEQEREWFEEEASDGENLHLLVTVDGERAGTVGLHPRVPENGSTEVGIFLAKAYWGEGYGTEAVELVVDDAFDEGWAHRVAARIVDGNEASRRLFEGLGFRHEATFGEATFHRGSYTDVHWYAVLEGEWRD